METFYTTFNSFPAPSHKHSLISLKTILSSQLWKSRWYHPMSFSPILFPLPHSISVDLSPGCALKSPGGFKKFPYPIPVQMYEIRISGQSPSVGHFIEVFWVMLRCCQVINHSHKFISTTRILSSFLPISLEEVFPFDQDLTLSRLTFFMYFFLSRSFITFYHVTL